MAVQNNLRRPGEHPPEAPEREPAVDVRGLRMRYGTHDVLNGVDLRVEQGEVLVLLGPNGAGKTTTVEILEGFRGRSSGEVSVLGIDPDRGNEAWRARLGVVLQSWRDHAKWRVRELLAHFAAHYAPYGTPERPRPRDVDELLETVGLTEQADAKVGSLSGGQRRRMDVAVGIVGRPELLFLDEPTAGFDPVARRDFHALVQRLAGEEGTTILLTTHDLDEAEKLADRILILSGGTIVAGGSPAALAAQLESDAEVRWTHRGERHVTFTPDGTGFARKLFERHGEEIEDLQVRRPGLEEVYLEMVRLHESGRAEEAAGSIPLRRQQ
ncbi:ABC transporter ATP-binding protein [Streptomyces cacaoi]|uniref:ABC transporter ATP-binding protein n=1 Tax=Streptomyces cacaoi TaxID=1898 RepID=UPI00374A2BFF